MTPASLPIADKIVRINATLTRSDIPFAFGGAIARNYYAEPRLTVYLDIGVYLPPEAHQRVIAATFTLFTI